MFSRLLLAGLAFASATFAANSTTTSNSTVAADVYTSSDAGITFALNVANDTDDLFFSISSPADGSWMAVGMGSNKMAGSLILMTYPSSNGENVTISPRLAYGHTEPSYTPNVTVQLLPGSGIINGTLTANGRCSNCRSWDGGAIDVTSKAQNMIFAYGPTVSDGDSAWADLKFHYTYGVFTMDLQRATGAGGVPGNTGPNTGAWEISIEGSHDFSAPLHACIMVFTFVGLFPFGILLLRVLGWTRFHGVNQAFATIMALIGASAGIYAGTIYNRTKNFNTGHQIFGLIIISAMVGQVILGILHHRMYKKSQSPQPTKLSPIHIWLGRFVIVGGIINCFVGFPLALAAHYDYVLLGLVIALALPFSCMLWWRRKREVRKLEKAEAKAANGGESPKLFTDHFENWSNGPGSGLGIELSKMGLGRTDAYNQPSVEPWRGV